MAESRVGLHGRSRKPVLLELRRADTGLCRLQSALFVAEQPSDDFVFGLAPRHKAMTVQPLNRQRAEHSLAVMNLPNGESCDSHHQALLVSRPCKTPATRMNPRFFTGGRYTKSLRKRSWRY